MEGYEAVDRAVADVLGWDARLSQPSCCEWVVIGGGGSEASGRVLELTRISTKLFHNIITRIR